MEMVSKYYKKYKARRNILILKTVGKATAFIASFVVAGSLCFHGLHGIKNLILSNFTNESAVEDQIEQEIPQEIPQETEFDISSNTISQEELVDQTKTEEEKEDETVEEQVSYYIGSELLDSGYEFKDVDFDSLTAQNEDVVGWVQINNTNVDYPILQDEDNEYYSHHDIDGNQRNAGSIFLDANNELLSNPTEELDDLNFIYGHHMATNTMFASICNYKKQSFVDENPFFVIYTADGYAYKCDVFAGVLCEGLDTQIYNKYHFSSQKNFEDYMDYINQNSMISTDVEVTYDDKIVALVTCSYENGINGNLRFVVFAKMTKQYTVENEEEYKPMRTVK